MLYGFSEPTLTIFVEEASILYSIVTIESIICTIFLCEKFTFCLSLINSQFCYQNGILKGYWPRSLQDIFTLILKIWLIQFLVLSDVVLLPTSLYLESVA